MSTHEVAWLNINGGPVLTSVTIAAALQGERIRLPNGAGYEYPKYIEPLQFSARSAFGSCREEFSSSRVEAKASFVGATT
jgi:hypothetical protein